MKNYDDEFDRYGAERDDEILDAEIADDDSDYDEILEGEYEDGYEYAGDRLGKVLDEIADLKRNIGESGASGGNYRYQTAGANEAALYNEINRLREELSRTQHSQSMQMEFNKMREELERDSKRKEEKLLSEIDNLQRQIRSVTVAENTEETDNAEVKDPGADVSALVKMNESLVEYTKSVSDKMAADIEQIKRTVADTPVLGEIKNKLDEITARPAVAPVQVKGGKPCRARREDRLRRAETDGTEIMRRLVDIRLAIGKLSQKEYENDLRLLSLYNTLTGTKSAIYSETCGLGDKLDAMRKLDNEIQLSDDCYIADVVDKYNELIEHLLDKTVTRDDIAVVSGLSKLDKIKSSLTQEGKAAVNRFVIIANAVLSSENVSAAIDKLPELVSLKNVIQNNGAKAENDALYSEILSLNSELVLSTDAASAAKCSEDMKAAIGALCRLSLREILVYPKMSYDKPVCAIAVHSYVRDAVEKAGAAETDGDAAVALTEAMDRLRASLAEANNGTSAELADLARKIAETQTENRDKILGELAELKSRLDNAERRQAETESAKPASSTPDEVNLFLSEIVSLRDELQAYKDEVSNFAEKRVVADTDETPSAGLGAVLDELSSIRADIGEYADELENLRGAIEAGGVAAVSEDRASGVGTSVLGDIRDDLEDIKRASESAVRGDELLSVRDEIIAELGKRSETADVETHDAVLSAVEEIKQQLADTQLYSAMNVTEEGDGAAAQELKALRESVDKLTAAYSSDSAIAEEIAALKAEMAEMKAMIAANSAPAGESRTDELIEKIYGDVRLMCDEPDYSVMNEILALREEYQNLKETINKAIGGADKANDSKLVDEIRALRDQIFAINMASVSDGEKESYESYNNLIIDELGRIRDELDSVAGKAGGGDAGALARLEKEMAEQKNMQASIVELLNRTLEQLQKQETMLKNKTDKMAEEIASTVDKELEKDDAKQAKVISDIENIKYTLGVMQGADKNDDADLEKSIEKLKEELSQVAGIINGDKKKH